MLQQDVATVAGEEFRTDRADMPGAGANQTATLQLDNVSKSYGKRKAVDGVSLTVRPGECLGLLGPNGAGKTTTILLICGLLAPESGTVAIGERHLPPTHAAARKSIGYVPQNVALYDDLTAKENLRFFGLLCGLRGKRLRSRMSEVLEFVGLTDRADERVGTYSGGMKRRLNIGVALLHDPQLLVLDEPTTGVDPQSRAAILDGLAQIRAEGRSILYSSHYMAEVEAISTEICIMDHGRIIVQGTHASLVGNLPGKLEKLMLTCTGPATSALPRLMDLPGVADASVCGPTLTVTLSDLARSLKDVLTILDQLSVSVTDLAVDRYSLEKLFLELTGCELRDE